MDAVMDPVMTISETDLVVEPGGVATATLRVRNTSNIIDEYELTALGESSSYAEVVPPRISVDVGDTVEATVMFRPPYDTTVATGQVPFGIRARSMEYPERGEVVEGDLTVGSINLLNVKITPNRSAGRWRAKHRVVLHNRGTERATVRLGTIDPEEKLSFALSPKDLDVGPASEAEAFLKVRPRKPAVFGQAIHHPFQVSYRRKADTVRDAYLGATTGGETEAFADASYEQRAIVARWMMVLGAIAVLIAGLIIYRIQTREPEVTVVTQELEAPNPPSALVTTTGRFPADSASGGDEPSFSISWSVPTAGAEFIDGYELVEINSESYFADPPQYLVIDTHQFAPGVSTVSPDAMREELGVTDDDIASGRAFCFLIRSVDSDDELGLSTASVLVGESGTLGDTSPVLPNPSCPRLLTDEQCGPPSVQAVGFDETEADRVTIQIAYDTQCELEEPQLAVRVNEIPVAVPAGTGRAEVFSFSVSEIDPNSDGQYVIVVDEGGAASEPRPFSASGLVENNEAIEDAAEAEVADDLADAEIAAEEAEGAVRPRSPYAVVFEKSATPVADFDLDREDAAITRFLQAVFRSLRKDELGVAESQVISGAVGVSFENVAYKRIVLPGVADGTFFVIVEDLDSAEAAAQLCDAMNEFLPGLYEDDWDELTLGDPPLGCYVPPQ